MKAWKLYFLLVVVALGLAVAVLQQSASYVEAGQASTQGFNGRFTRSEWRPRLLAAALARAVHADRAPGLWTGAWFLASCLVWIVALRERALLPMLICAAGALWTYTITPQRTVGVLSSDAPTLFMFTLAAVTADRPRRAWPLIGLIGAGFKQTLLVLPLVLGVEALWHRKWRRSLLLLGSSAAVLLALLLSVGRLAWPLTRLHLPHHGGLRVLTNLTDLADPMVVLTCAGLFLAGLPFLRGRAIAVVAVLAGTIIVFARVNEARLWLEALPFCAFAIGQAVTRPRSAPGP